MTIYRVYLFLLFLLAYQLPMLAQVNCSIIKESQKDSVIIQGILQNSSEFVLDLHYIMTVFKAGKSGRSANTQRGAFKAVPVAKTLLSQVSLNVLSDDYYKVTLSVFEKSKLISSDTLEHGSLPKKKVAPSQKNTQQNTNSTFDPIEIDGLIIDETRTKSARDFYEFFYNKWSPPRGAKDYTIIIRELPSRGRSAQVNIEVNNQVVFQRFLQPRLELIEAHVNQAIYHLGRHLSKNESLKKQMGDEDHKGSGIF